MNIKKELISLILILTLSFSCINNKSTEKEVIKPELVSTSKSDSLKFTSGIRALFQDSKGNYWIGSHDEGVSYYDGSSFKYFTVNEGLADNQVRSIHEYENGHIWFGTANGISNYNGKTVTSHPINENLDPEWTKTDNDLWFNAGTLQGVYKYDGQKLKYLAFPNTNTINTDNVYLLTSLSTGKNNMLWFGTFAGIFGYNGNQFTTINDETLGLTEESERLHVRSILEDSQGRLWIGNNGIGVILKSGDSIFNFSKAQGKLMPMKAYEANIQSQKFTKNTGLQAVFAITEDSEGNIWFGDRDSGAWKYDGISLINYTVDSKLKSQMIWTIYEDQDKNLLFGMADGDIYKFNGKTFDNWH